MSTELTTTDKAEEQGLSQQMSKFKVLEDFTKLLNKEPDPKSLIDTFDKKAKTLPISLVETLLDEVYLRQWGTRDVTVTHIVNEIIVTLTLWVIDPLTGREITRSGFAAVSMQWDAVPDEMKWKQGEPLQAKRDRNAWGMDLQNKKAESLKMAFPKAKSMAIKNAAQTLGKSFGRDINRKIEDSPEEFYGDLINNTQRMSEAIKALMAAKDVESFDTIWSVYIELQESEEFKKNFMYYKRRNIK